MIDVAPRPNATGIPDISISNVATRTRVPWVPGLMGHLPTPAWPAAARTPRHLPSACGQTRAPDGIRTPAFGPCLVPILGTEDPQHQAEAQRQHNRKQREPIADVRSE